MPAQPCCAATEATPDTTGLRPWICDAGTPVGIGGSPGASSESIGETIARYLMANEV